MMTKFVKEPSNIFSTFFSTPILDQSALMVKGPMTRFSAKSSTTLALLDMLRDWSKGTDGNSATIRIVLFHYRKAFDLIDHSILIRKLCMLDVPNSIVNWIIDFLSNRSQRIKLGEGYVSEWESVPSGVPQGTKSGPWLFFDYD